MPDVEFLTVSVDLLRKNTWNSNKVSVLNENKIRNSIERNGLFKPILVRQVTGHDGYEIIGGEHRWEQAVELGHETVPIANLGFISTEKAKEIGVIDNARYGIDDTLMFADILKDIGGIDEIQDFLPYGEDDLTAIFSASSIALEDLEEAIPAAEEDEPDEAPLPKPPKTHTVMRFKVSLGDAERLTALIASTQKTHGFTTADDLTNAGDALVHLLSAFIAPATTAAVPEDWNDILDDIENSK
jgi:ParB-like chromosome segregation protein Spo0J